MSDGDWSVDELRAYIAYDPETGMFCRIAEYGRKNKKCPLGVWFLGSVDGSVGYRRLGVAGRSVYAHRLAWFLTHGEWPRGQIDHINGDRKDNRIANLRDVSSEVNKQNIRSARRHNKSGVLGALLTPQGRFASRIVHKGKTKFLGSFGTANEAHEAYLSAKRELHAGCTI